MCTVYKVKLKLVCSWRTLQKMHCLIQEKTRTRVGWLERVKVKKMLVVFFFAILATSGKITTPVDFYLESLDGGG